MYRTYLYLVPPSSALKNKSLDYRCDTTDLNKNFFLAELEKLIILSLTPSRFGKKFNVLPFNHIIRILGTKGRYKNLKSPRSDSGLLRNEETKQNTASNQLAIF